jgi:hypothetical protein
MRDSAAPPESDLADRWPVRRPKRGSATGSGSEIPVDSTGK